MFIVQNGEIVNNVVPPVEGDAWTPPSGATILENPPVGVDIGAKLVNGVWETPLFDMIDVLVPIDIPVVDIPIVPGI